MLRYLNMWLIIIILSYLFLVFILSRFVIPHLGNGVDLLPTKIPADMEKTIVELKAQVKTKEEFLNLAFQFLGKKYRSERLNTIIKFNYLFKPLEEIWSMSGYIPCTQSNYLLRIFLVNSGFFRENEIKKRHVFLNFVIHQSLKVKLDKKWVNVEVGEADRGIKIGEYLKFFTR